MCTLTTKERVINTVIAIPGFSRIADVSGEMLTFIFERIPSYSEQLGIQQAMTPGVEQTKDVRCFGYHDEDNTHHVTLNVRVRL